MTPLQTLEASRAIAEAFRLQHEVGAVQSASEQLSREIADLERDLAHQRANRAILAQTEAAKLYDEAHRYRELAKELTACCEIAPSMTASAVATGSSLISLR